MSNRIAVCPATEEERERERKRKRTFLGQCIVSSFARSLVECFRDDTKCKMMMMIPKKIMMMAESIRAPSRPTAALPPFEPFCDHMQSSPARARAPARARPLECH